VGHGSSVADGFLVIFGFQIPEINLKVSQEFEIDIFNVQIVYIALLPYKRLRVKFDRIPNRYPADFNCCNALDRRLEAVLRIKGVIDGCLES